MPPVEERLEAGLRRRLAGLPAFAQARGPVRPGGLELPVFERIAREVRYAVQLRRRGQRSWWIAQRLHPPPDGVNTRRPRFSLLRIPRGATSRSPGKLCEPTPISPSARRPDRPRPDAALARSRSRTRSRRRSRAPVRRSPWRRSLAQHQRGAEARPGSPARRAATAPATSVPRRRAAGAGRLLVEHVHADHRRACLAAAWRAGWSERRRSSRNQTMAGRGVVMRA